MSQKRTKEIDTIAKEARKSVAIAGISWPVRLQKMSTKTVEKTKIERLANDGTLTPSESAVIAQIAEYYRLKKLYAEGKITEKLKLPECSEQKYKDMYYE